MDAFERMARVLLGNMSAMSADMFASLRGDEDDEKGFQGEPTRLLQLQMALKAAGASDEQIGRAMGLVAEVDVAVQLSQDLVFYRVRKDRKGDQDLGGHESLFVQGYLADVWACTGDQLNPSARPSDEQDASVRPAQTDEDSDEEEPAKKSGSTVVRASPPPGGKRPEPAEDEDDSDEEDPEEDDTSGADEYEDRSARALSRAAVRKGGYRVEVDKDSTAKLPPKTETPRLSDEDDSDEPDRDDRRDRRDRGDRNDGKGKGRDRRETNPELRALQEEVKSLELEKKRRRLEDELGLDVPVRSSTVSRCTAWTPRPEVLFDPKWVELRTVFERHLETERTSGEIGRTQVEYWLTKISRSDVTAKYGAGVCQRARNFVRDYRAGLDERDMTAYARTYYDHNWEPTASASAL